MNLPRVAPLGAPVLALGADQRNTVCAWHGTHWQLSPELGDLHTLAARARHTEWVHQSLQWMARETDAPLQCVAHDAHPDFFSTQHAAQLAATRAVRTLAVQHHHAHIAAVCAEWGLTGPVLGLALDGFGLGSDGEPWGGELLRVAGAHCVRLGHLRRIPLVGGDRATQEPWRLAAAVLHALGQTPAIEKRLGAKPHARAVADLLAKPQRWPQTSSLGRLFDAAAVLLGLGEHTTPGAALALSRAAAQHGPAEPWPQTWRIDAQGELDWRGIMAALLQEPDVGLAAARFEATWAHALADWAIAAGAAQGLRQVVFAGGCLANPTLTRDLPARVAHHGLDVFQARDLPCGDAAIALGQAWVAQAFLRDNPTPCA